MSGSGPKRLAPFYNRQFDQQEFTLQQIDDQGRFALYKALNIGRVVAFVGSGVSAAYGRTTWTKLIEEPVDTIVRSFLNDDKEPLSIDNIHDLESYTRDAFQHLSASKRKTANALLRSILEVRRSREHDLSDPDYLPLLAHLYNILISILQDERPQSKVSSAAQAANAPAIHKHIQSHTASDEAAAFQSWRSLLSDDDIERFLSAQIDPKWTRHRLISHLDTIEFLRHLAAGTQKSRANLVSIVTALLSEHTASKDKLTRLSARHRLLIPFTLAVRALDKTKLDAKWLLGDFTNFKSKYPNAEPEADAMRDNTADTARFIFEGLSIKRVVTTNYDFELERALERLGFARNRLRPNSDGTHTVRTTDLAMTSERPRGGQARTLVLDHSTTAEMIGFAVHTGRYEYEVFHLHGRAIKEETAGLVVTERDYQGVYMQDTPEAHVMNEALSVTMGGNPIIFLGMGMLEADILRPLRRFVSSPGRNFNRSLVALMPAEASQSKREKFALSLYLRYGVHVLYYGLEPTDPAPAGKKVAVQAFWARPWGPRSAKDRIFDTSALYKALRRIWAIQADLKTPPKNVLKWISQKRDTDVPLKDVLGPVRVAVKPSSTYHAHGIALEPTSGTIQKAIDACETLLFYEPIWEPRNTQSREMLINFLSGLEHRVRTEALCAGITGLAEDRKLWWNHWQTEPESRRFAHVYEFTHPFLKLESGTSVWDACDGIDLTPNQDPTNGPKTFRSVRFPLVQTQAYQDTDTHVLNAIREIQNEPNRSGRRIFVVHCEEGEGRGSFYNAFADRFARKVDAGDNTGPLADAGYAWANFSSTTFSTEYSSVIDGLVEFILPHPGAKADPKSTKVRHPRSETLIRALKTFYKTDYNSAPTLPHSGQRRGLIVISGLELLFRRQNGTPKNNELGSALGKLMSPATEAMPLDIVLVCRTNMLQTIFSMQPEDLLLSRSDICLKDGAGDKCSESKTSARFIHILPPNGQEVIDSVVKPMLHHKAESLFDNVPHTFRGNWARKSTKAGRVFKTRFHTSLVARCSVEVFKQTITARLKVNTLSEADRSLITGFHNSEWLTCLQKAPGGEEIFTDAAKSVREFLEHIGDRATRAESVRRRDLVLETVLHQYATLDNATNTDTADSLSELYETILKHLSIFSLPVELCVLARCPQIRQLILLNSEQNTQEQEDSFIISKLTSCLNTLKSRQLCFEVRKRGDAHSGTSTVFSRYVVHQSLQSYFFHKIGSPHLEFGDSRLFTVSMLASQRDDLPTPTLEAYSFFMETLKFLIEYPDAHFEAKTGRKENDRAIDVCCLRSALGLVRSSFSLSVVSRFCETMLDHVPVHQAFGYFEQYRLVLRWIIFQAGMLGIEVTQSADGKILDPGSEGSSGCQNRLNALYPDEVAWIYNECGLVSLAQGNLYDAMALFRAASGANGDRDIGKGMGPNGLRIRLNLAVANIDRGQLDRAHAELSALVAACETELVVGTIAIGYLGRIAQLRGRVVDAEGQYKVALAKLRKLGGEARAVSIFSRFYGDLLSERDPGKARALIQDALAEAENARQHDQVQRARVTLIRIEAKDPNLRADDAKKLLLRIEEVLRYADRMELNSLKVDALIARAFVIERQGETRGAAEAVVQALSIANLNGLRLRVIRGLGLLGKIVAGRPGYRDQARRILNNCKLMAEAANYQVMLEEAEKELISLGSKSHQTP